MSGTCFVIMPFGGDFDKLYTQVYEPAIREAGLEPLRADRIYSNQVILEDIFRSIRSARAILADVTGRNPNVNYEVGAAHALGKEVIFTTADIADVPSDYRHFRCIVYRRTDPRWGESLGEQVKKYLDTVLRRTEGEARTARLEALERAAEPAWLRESEEELWEDREEKQLLERAKRLGFRFQQDSHSLSSGLMCSRECHVMLSRREGPLFEADAAMACLLNEKVYRLSADLPEYHCLRLREVFFDLYASHAFYVDYLYDRKELPLFTERELYEMLEEELCGQIFVPQIRYTAENFHHDRFYVDSDQYYTLDGYGTDRPPICFREGMYVAEVLKIFHNEGRGDFFYQLNSLLPLSVLGAEAYVSGESHWLADRQRQEPQCGVGDVVAFRFVRGAKEVRDWSHTPKTRNIEFSELEVVLKANRC